MAPAVVAGRRHALRRERRRGRGGRRSRSTPAAASAAGAAAAQGGRAARSTKIRRYRARRSRKAARARLRRGARARQRRAAATRAYSAQLRGCGGATCAATQRPRLRRARRRAQDRALRAAPSCGRSTRSAAPRARRGVHAQAPRATRAFRQRDRGARDERLPDAVALPARGLSCPDARRVLGARPAADRRLHDRRGGHARRRGALVWLAAKGLGTGPNTGRRADISELMRGPRGRARRARPTTEWRALTRARRPPGDADELRAGARRTRRSSAPAAGRATRSSTSSTWCARTAPTTRSSAPSRAARATRGSRCSTTTACPGPTGGVTPNAHALARRFPLLDNVYANSEESTAGHKITAGGYANDYTQRYVNSEPRAQGEPRHLPDRDPAQRVRVRPGRAPGRAVPRLRRAGRAATSRSATTAARPSTVWSRTPTTRTPRRSRAPAARRCRSRPAPRTRVRCTADSGEVDRVGQAPRPAVHAEPDPHVRSRSSSSRSRPARCRASTT